MRACKGNYRTIRGNTVVSIHPSSIIAKFGVPPEWVIYNDVVQSKLPQLRDLTCVDPLWLIELANHYYTVKDIPLR